jgi:hypothetical protein
VGKGYGGDALDTRPVRASLEEHDDY